MNTKGTGGLGGWLTGGGHPNDSINKNGQNTEKSPGDLRRLAVPQTPVKNHRLTLIRKALIIIIRTFQNNERDKIGYSETTKENVINNWKGMTEKHTNNQTPEKPNDFGRKYDNQKSITKRLNE